MNHCLTSSPHLFNVQNLDCLRDLTGTMQIEGVLGRIESVGTLAKQSHGPGLYKQLDSIISMSDELFFAMSELQDYKNHSKFQAFIQQL